MQGAPTLRPMEFDRIEALRIGQELKKIRKQRGLSLAEVEALSAGQWKAVVVGSYERADRAITVGRLSALMSFYQAPINTLFPAKGGNDSTEERREISFDLNRRHSLSREHLGIHRFLGYVINARGDWNGHILSIRCSDFQGLAIFESLSFEELYAELAKNRFLLQWR